MSAVSAVAVVVAVKVFRPLHLEGLSYLLEVIFSVDVLNGLASLFFSSVSAVVTGAPFFIYLLFGAVVCALIFNLIHEVLG